jgi:hypothetical protein
MKWSWLISRYTPVFAWRNEGKYEISQHICCPDPVTTLPIHNSEMLLPEPHNIQISGIILILIREILTASNIFKYNYNLRVLSSGM